MTAPAERIRIRRSQYHGEDVLEGWVGIEFVRIAKCYEADEGLRVLERVLECQKRDLLDEPAEGG